MTMSKVAAYLRAREGQEVPYEELVAAGLASSPAVLDADLSRLIADPRRGITRIGRRQQGVRRPYRYDVPVPEPGPVYVTLRLIGQTEGGNGLAQDEETGKIYEILPLGRLDQVNGGRPS